MINPYASNAMEYSSDTLFSVDIKTKLTGNSGEYTSYTENERDIRTYKISSIKDNEISWIVNRKYTYSDSDGGSSSSSNSISFYTDTNRNYIRNTADGDTKYYTFDKIWFRIDVDNIAIGDTVRILGFDYQVKALTYKLVGKLTAVDVWELSLKNGQETYTVNTYDYDPDGTLDIIFSETLYFDKLSGYIVEGHWQATGQTSVGSFTWDETTTLTGANFELSKDPYALPIVYKKPLTILVLVIIAIIVIPILLKKSWKRQVEKSIQIISNIYSAPIPEGEVSVWNPLNINHEELLIDYNPNMQNVYLQNGIYLMIDTLSRLTLADVNSDRFLPAHFMNFREDNLKLMFRLALGVIDYNSTEYAYLTQNYAGLGPYLFVSNGFAVPDAIALAMYQSTYGIEDPLYGEVSVLMARRKVLDYSLGQAPLSPYSHLRKFRKIMNYTPNHVLMVGDDDLISVTLARNGVNVTLLEIDPYTCALIKGIAMQENLNINVYQIDLRDALPSDLTPDFDLFVADPDFTIEAFALFLSRGLSLLKDGGIGLINFENNKAQRFKADYLLELLNIKVLERDIEPWTYVVINNVTRSTTSNYYGKYTEVDYTKDLVLTQAAYSSVMFVVQKDANAKLVLAPDAKLEGSSKAIYDI